MGPDEKPGQATETNQRKAHFFQIMRLALFVVSTAEKGVIIGSTASLLSSSFPTFKKNYFSLKILIIKP
jgi:hypothetical protein